MKRYLPMMCVAAVLAASPAGQDAAAGEGYIQPGTPIYYACMQKWTIANMSKAARDAYLDSVCAYRFIVY